MGAGAVTPATGPAGCRGTDRGPQTIPLGRCIFRNVTAGFFISIISIVDQKEYKLGQLPGWVTTEGFDIEAKAERPVTQEQLALMLKAVLIDRFKCTFHVETKDVSGFALVSDRRGAKLTRSASQDLPTAKEVNSSVIILDDATKRQMPIRSLASGRPAILVGQRASLSTLATFISRFWTAPVVDKTGLSGLYDFQVHWQPEGSLGSTLPERTGPSFNTSLSEELGLRLEPARVSVEILIVDHIERPTYP
jgi:uncharacterized protein (TIGR03435 family)